MQALDEKLLEKCKSAKRVVVLTGAGISAESGIPTFRGKDGYWKNYRAEDLANWDAFQKNPALVWEWYQMRMKICQNSKPNPGHYAVAEMENIFPEFLLITQNVDNLHRKAGSTKIIELHGNIFTARCTKCNHMLSIESVEFPIPPICTSCQGLVRPNILWFGESYDEKVLESSIHFLRTSDLIFIVGTSGQVTVPVYLAEEAIRHGAFSIEINPNPSTLSRDVNIHIQASSASILSKLISTLKNIYE